jgi:hypothetical protein
MQVSDLNPCVMATACKIARTATDGFAHADRRLLGGRLSGSSVASAVAVALPSARRAAAGPRADHSASTSKRPTGWYGSRLCEIYRSADDAVHLRGRTGCSIGRNRATSSRWRTGRNLPEPEIPGAERRPDWKGLGRVRGAHGRLLREATQRRIPVPFYTWSTSTGPTSFSSIIVTFLRAILRTSSR